MKNWLITLLLVCLQFVPLLTVVAQTPEHQSALQTDTSVTLPQREHPFLFLNKSAFEQVARRGPGGDQPFAGSSYKAIMQSADVALNGDLNIPKIPSEWNHHYVCKDCGIRLQHVESKHRCPRCEREYTGWPYDGVIAGHQHARNIIAARDLGLAWQLTGREAYAERGRDILLAYADIYESFPIHDYRGGKSVTGARLSAQTLDESVRMISAAWAYDLVATEPGTTSEHREKITDRLLRPAAGVIRRNDKGISNWQSWHNAALAAIGFAIHDAELVDHAINGPSGIKFQMRESVLEDGFWYEGTASYHFYALNALQQQVLAMKEAGMDFYLDPVFRSMYKGPLDYMFPDGTFPAVNDSSPIPISGLANHYELAYAWYGEPEYAAIAGQGNRNSLEALLWGASELPDRTKLNTGSRNFTGLGAVMLRQNQGTGDAMAVHFDYGPHGGGHGHNDKLGIIFFANGRDVVPDAGRLDYGAPLHEKWYKRTISHNTVIVDGKDQEATEGQLVSTHFDGRVQLATAACDTAYSDVTLTRSLALTPEYLLDVVTGAGKQEHTWDLAYHVYGDPKITADLLTPVSLPQKDYGYEVLMNVQELTGATSGGLDITFAAEETNGKGVKLVQADTGSGQVILADGFAGAQVTTCSVLLSRKSGVREATWITLINPQPEVREIKLMAQSDGIGWLVSVEIAGRVDKFNVRDGEITQIPTAK